MTTDGTTSGSLYHNFRTEPTGEAADRFRAWLEAETVGALRRGSRDTESLKGAIFLYVNRAYEAHLPEDEIGTMFGKCYVVAGCPVENEAFAFDCLEELAEVARRANDDPR